MGSFPTDQLFTKAESLLSLNNHAANPNITVANQMGDALGSMLDKKLVIADDGGAAANRNNNGEGDLLTDETDNELFASFSSCSSRFRLNSISTNNSPVLFMNELGANPASSSSKLNSELHLNLSPSSNALYAPGNHMLSAASHTSVVENNKSSSNKLAKALFLPIEPIKVFIYFRNYTHFNIWVVEKFE